METRIFPTFARGGTFFLLQSNGVPEKINDQMVPPPHNNDSYLTIDRECTSTCDVVPELWFGVVISRVSVASESYKIV